MSETTHDLLIKPITVGVTGGVMSMALIPSGIKILGLPAPVGMAASLAAASFVNGVANETIYETFLSDNESELVYNATAPVITGFAAVGVGWMTVGDKATTKGLAQLFALGAAAEILGGYIDESLLGPAMDL